MPGEGSSFGLGSTAGVLAQGMHSEVNPVKKRQVEEDELSLAGRSTVAPSDSLEGAVSEVSFWDAANLLDLSSCGVLSPAATRRSSSGLRGPPAQGGGRDQTGPAAAEHAPRTSAELRAARLLQCRRDEGADAKVEAAAAPPAERSARPGSAPRRAAGQRNGAARAEGTEGVAAAPRSWQVEELRNRLDQSGKKELRDMGLWERMPARNPVVTQTDKGASWHVAFPNHEDSLGGAPQAPPTSRPPGADEVGRQLDKCSREQLHEAGLWERMPARNPVVTQTDRGASWHICFAEEAHGGEVPCQGKEAEALARWLDQCSREELREAGFWERMPTRNPVVSQTDRGASWHIAFPDSERSAGAPPEAGSVPRPSRADELTRWLDKCSHEELRDAGLWERMPARNPVVTQTDRGASWHIDCK